MTAKEKALELFNRMCNSVDELLPLDVKECALIAVDELIESIHIGGNKRFWQDVKQEIENL